MALVVIDFLEFDPADGGYPDVVHISGDVYAIAYCKKNAPRPGYIKTVSIDSAGEIGSVLDTLEFDAGGGVNPSIIHISGDIYAIAYSGPDNDGWLATVEISSAGVITDTIIDSHEFDTSRGWAGSILHISGTTYAIAYAGPDDDGWLKTITIGDDGSISADPELDSLEYSTSAFGGHYMIHVYGDIYAIVYTGYDATTKYDNRVVTVDINSAGAIEDSVVDTLQIIPPGSPSLGVVSTGRIVHLAGDVYAFVTEALNADSAKRIFLYTITISAAGAISDAVVDSLELAVGRFTPDLIKISDQHYAIAYSWLNQGSIKTIIIEPDGTIGSVTDTLEFEDDYCGPAPFIISITEDILAIAYEGSGYDGWLKTIGPVTLPVVTTNPATNVKETSATLNGTLVDDGSEACEVRFQYGLTTNYGTNTDWQAGKETGDTFSQLIVELVCGTLYHFRAQAKNSAGTANGNDRTLTTITPFMAKRAYALSREEL